MYYLLKFIEVIERKKMLNCVMLFRNIFRIPLYYKKKTKLCAQFLFNFI